MILCREEILSQINYLMCIKRYLNVYEGDVSEFIYSINNRKKIRAHLGVYSSCSFEQEKSLFHCDSKHQFHHHQIELNKNLFSLRFENVKTFLFLSGQSCTKHQRRYLFPCIYIMRQYVKDKHRKTVPFTQKNTIYHRHRIFRDVDKAGMAISSPQVYNNSFFLSDDKLQHFFLNGPFVRTENITILADKSKN